MNRLAAAVRRAFMLRARHVIAFAVPAFGLMMHALATGVPPALAWPLYAASAYALAVIVVAAVRAFRRLSRMPLPAFLEARPLVRRWRADLHLRIGVGLAVGLATNLLCVALKLVVGLFTGNGWLVALGGYYAVLAFMRMVLIAGWGRELPMDAQWRRYRACGMALVPLNQALMVVVIYLVHENIAYDYPGNLIYAMALYAFYAVIAAVAHLARRRGAGSPLIAAASAINLVCALVSLLALQTALIARFGGGDAVFPRVMNSVTGGFVCLTVLAMGVHMVVRSGRARSASGAWAHD